MPVWRLLWDVSREESMKRVEGGGAKERLEQESAAFQQRVREGYDQVKALYPQRVHVIDAHGSIEEVTDACLDEIERVIAEDA